MQRIGEMDLMKKGRLVNNYDKRCANKVILNTLRLLMREQLFTLKPNEHKVLICMYKMATSISK